MAMKFVLRTIKPMLIQYLRERGLVLPEKTIKELASKLKIQEQRLQVIVEAVKEAILEHLERL